MFKKITIRSILTLALLIPFLIFASPVHAAEEAVINFDNLNVRTGPGTTYNKLKQVHQGDTFPVVQVDGDWVEIDLGVETGWVTKEFITLQITPTSEGALPINETSLIITNENTHMRSGPSTNDAIVVFLQKDAEYDILSESRDWYEIEHEGEQGYIYKKLLSATHRSTQHSLKNKVIVIDAGHGGYDVGSISVNGHYEKDLAYKTAMELEEELTLLGASVILTREDDDYIRLGSRSILSNIEPTDAFISIHYNSFPENTSVTGINSYYFHRHSSDLASYIQEGLVDASGANDRGIAHGNFHVLRQNFKPAVLLELDFISNQEREQLLLTNAYQKKLVQGIVNGLTHYFTENKHAGF